MLARSVVIIAACCSANARSLVGRLSRELGDGYQERLARRLHVLEDEFRPMFNALPKNAHGRLGSAATRYAMHRAFVHMHGIYVKGLEPAASDKSPTVTLEERAPVVVREILESVLKEDGLGLQDVAAFAAVLEHLAHEEARGMLTAAFNLTVPDAHKPIDEDTALTVLGSFMVTLTAGENRDNSGKREELFRTGQSGPGSEWSKLQTFVLDALGQVRASRAATQPIMFETLEKAADIMLEGFGRHRNASCATMKRELLSIEDGQAGRISMAKFYESALSGGSAFEEKPEYLRYLGILDESRPGLPTVLIPNYINSPTACQGTTRFYTFCCFNECEELLRHVETQVGRHEASPALLRSIVESLPSGNLSAPRTLPPNITGRLAEIAALHRGKVPLYGRLFALFMNLAFPQQCPRPLPKGAVSNLSVADLYMLPTENRLSARTEMVSQISDYRQEMEYRKFVLDAGVDPDEAMQKSWSADDDEPMVPDASPNASEELWRLDVALITLVLIVSLGLTILQLLRGVRKNTSRTKPESSRV